MMTKTTTIVVRAAALFRHRPAARIHQYSCCIRSTPRSAAADANQLRCQNLNFHHRHYSSANVATRLHLPTLGQNGTLHLIDDRRSHQHQHHGGVVVPRVHIVPSQKREDSIIDFVLPASFATSASSGRGDDDDDSAAAKSVVHTTTFEGELLFSTSSPNPSLYSTNPRSSSTMILEKTPNLNTATIRTEFGIMLQISHHVNGKQTSLGRVGPFVTVKISDDIVAREETKRKDDEMIVLATPPPAPLPSMMPMDIVIRIPQKFNISCFINRGDLIVGSEKDKDIHNHHYEEDNGKLEGDLHLRTSSGGNIALHGKVRGHDVALESLCGIIDHEEGVVGGSRGAIHARKSIEAGKVRIRTNSPAGRVRARMLKVGSSMSIDVSSTSRPRPPDPSSSSASTTTENTSTTTAKLDDDDEGAMIDVGSMYILSNDGGADENEARLNVHVSGDDGDDVRSNGLVRVKSSHGHIVVRASDGRRASSSSASSSELVQSSTRKNRAPLIDLGGVNGSCDVMLEALRSSSQSLFGLTVDNRSDKNIDLVNCDNESPCHDQPDLRVHFDSMSPESISTITSRRVRRVSDYGELLMNSITMDRKLEADVRLLSVEAMNEDHCIDAHSLTESDDMEYIQRTLMNIANLCSSSSSSNNNNKYSKTDNNKDNFRKKQSIFIESNAYVDGWYNTNEDGGRERTLGHLSRHGIEYTHGSMTNRSGEPDSRSDIRSSLHRHDGGEKGGSSGGGGKINIQGAASQALHGFRGKWQETDSVDASIAPTSITTPMPLLAVSTDGIIKLETLSWFGSIARRYGLEENAGRVAALGAVGRQATRSPRFEK